jgi:hypothetical protein
MTLVEAIRFLEPMVIGFGMGWLLAGALHAWADRRRRSHGPWSR